MSSGTEVPATLVGLVEREGMEEDGDMSATDDEGMEPPPVIADAPSPEPPRVNWSLIWKMAGILMGIVFVAAVMGLPYLMEFVRVSGAVPVERPDVLLAALLMVDRLFLSALAVALGLWLGDKVGLEGVAVNP